MAVLNELINSLHRDAPIRSILVGAHWTVVCSRFCGIASTLIGDQPHGSSQVRGVGQLHHKSAFGLSEYALSENLLEASIGVAALNSLLEVDDSGISEINAVDVLTEHGRGKKVALIGHFPFVSRLRPAVGDLWVIEQRPIAGEYPAEAAEGLVPQADVVAITSSTIINHTLDGLLRLCRPDALVLMIGPSTPLSPVLFDFGVSILAGSKVVDSAAVLRTVGQGATFQQVKGVRLLSLTRDNWSKI